ncbi:MAG: hypothetical protein AABY22_28910 [Nanoarchaeota archaeon]
MSKKCVYCSNELNDGRAIDVCDRCGIGVWGEKMFNAIRSQMDDARQKGNLNQGFIGEGS